MSGLLMKDLELLKVNIKTYFIVFAVGIIYLFVQTDGSIFFHKLYDLCKSQRHCRNDFL